MSYITAGWVANSVGPDQLPLSVVSDLGLHCLLRSVCPSINTGSAEPRYGLPLQTVWIRICWLLKKPTDLDLHYH